MNPDRSDAPPRKADLQVIGPLRVVSASGADLTPPGAKAQGVLALLAASPGLRRPRVWLQDKLWSDSDQELGAASLRQTLRRLRQGLGEAADCVVSERAWIGLDPRLIRIVEPEDHDWPDGLDVPDYCEGLDIADPEFEDWIRDHRLAFFDRCEEARERVLARRRREAALAAAPEPHARPCLLIAATDANTPAMRTLGDILARDVATLVASYGAAEILTDAPEDHALPPPARALRLRVRAYDDKRDVMVRAHLEDPRRNALIWSSGQVVHDYHARLRASGPDALQVFVAEVSNVVSFELGRRRAGAPGDEAASLGYRALQHVTNLTPQSLDAGDALLGAAYAANPAPAYLAWRAHIRIARLIERCAGDREETLAEAVDLVERAGEADPFNPLVLAFRSDVTALAGGPADLALSLARSAAQAGPANPFARASLAYRLAWTSDTRRAHLEAQNALQLAARAPNQMLWVMRCCLTAARAGRYREAIRYGRMAHSLAPTFRPPLRYLAALHYHLGDDEAALKALDKLKRLEPDFSLEMLRDPHYPVTTMRGTPLMRLADSRLLDRGPRQALLTP